MALRNLFGDLALDATLRDGSQVTEVTNFPAVQSVSDNGGSLTVDDGGVTISVDDGGASITIDGTVGISGTVTVDTELTTSDLDTGAGTDTRAVVGLLVAESGGGQLVGSAHPLPTTLVPTATNNGMLTSRLISAATTNATNVKGSAGKIYKMTAFNNGSSHVYLKMYDLAVAPTPGSSTGLVATLMIPANGGLIDPSDFGTPYTTGIGFTITANMADSDTTAIAANQVALNIRYI